MRKLEQINTWSMLFQTSFLTSMEVTPDLHTTMTWQLRMMMEHTSLERIYSQFYPTGESGILSMGSVGTKAATASEETISKQLNSEDVDVERPTYEFNIEADPVDKDIPNCCHKLPYSLCDRKFTQEISQDHNKFVNFMMALRSKIEATISNEDGSTSALCHAHL